MTTTDYQNQAREFLNECTAEMTITPAGFAKPRWDTKEHAVYFCKIKTLRGEMTTTFYDSLHNTERVKMTPSEYLAQHMRIHPVSATYSQKQKAIKEVEKIRKDARPTEHDVLACLQKYDIGTMDDFLSEFGYEIKSAKDMTDFIDTYNAVVKEYRDLCRCFTTEQLEKLREIQ